MEKAVAREEAAARWLRDLRAAETAIRRAWPRDITARMSEFELLTLVSEILVPVWNDFRLEFEETPLRDQPDQQPGDNGLAVCPRNRLRERMGV